MKLKILSILTISLVALSYNGVGHAYGTGDKKGCEQMAAKTDIVDTAVSAGSFSTLVTALQQANLVETLKGEGPFTVFAPTDEAFANLPEGTLTNLLKPENKDQLTAILTYHVIPSKVMASEVVAIDSASTVNGKNINISSDADGVKIDQANIVQTDIKSSNGVIHVIDAVLLP